MAEETRRKDTELVISWLKEDLEYYKKNKGNITKFWTPITQKLIDSTEQRIKELEDKL